MPTYGPADAPVYLYAIPEEERAHRSVLQSDICVIDDKLYLIRGCIEIPVDGAIEPFICGSFVDVSQVRKLRGISWHCLATADACSHRLVLAASAAGTSTGASHKQKRRLPEGKRRSV